MECGIFYNDTLDTFGVWYLNTRTNMPESAIISDSGIKFIPFNQLLSDKSMNVLKAMQCSNLFPIIMDILCAKGSADELLKIVIERIAISARTGIKKYGEILSLIHDMRVSDNNVTQAEKDQIDERITNLRRRFNISTKHFSPKEAADKLIKMFFLDIKNT